MKERVEADTANLTGSSFKIDRSKRFKKKTSVGDALASLSSLNAMSDNYQDVYSIYLRRLKRLIAGAAKNSSDWKGLKATAAALNIDLGGRFAEADFIKLLARLRALDLIEQPDP